MRRPLVLPVLLLALCSPAASGEEAGIDALLQELAGLN
jgi:hypothetical protein